MDDRLTYYRATVPDSAVERTPLQSHRHARVCVVGSGFAGLNTALGLQDRGIEDVVILEKHEIASGASGRNGGFVFGGFSLGERILTRHHGAESARELYGLTLNAVQRIRRRIRDRAIECDVCEAGVLWANWFKDDTLLQERTADMRAVGVDWEYLPPEAVRMYVRSERYGAGMLERDAFHFHPLKYAAVLARWVEGNGGRIFGSSPVSRIERDGARWRVWTAGGSVSCETLVLSCGGYLAALDGEVDAAIMPIATYVLVTEPLGQALDEVMPGHAAVYDTRFAFDYYRRLPESRLLWGGRISILGRTPRQVAGLLRKDLAKVFPSLRDARVDYAWNGWMGYARHQMPQLTRREPGLWIAQAFGGHGIATTHAAGELVAEAIVRDARGEAMTAQWNALQRYGLQSAYKPIGLAAAQLEYWRAELMDALKA